MDDLSPSERAELHALLLKVQRELQSTGDTMADHATTVHLDQAAVGRVSRVDALQQQQMADAQKRRNELRLKQVAVALRAFEDDSYGDCKVCGEPIGYRRLLARPESPACVACMAELERS
ncbi:MAG: TraR/DksA family transcriptional regulator [Myxococcota bacterium]